MKEFITFTADSENLVLDSFFFFRFDSDSCHPYLTKVLRGRAAVGSARRFSKNRHEMTEAADRKVA